MDQAVPVEQLAEEANVLRYTFSDAELKVAQEALVFSRAAVCGTNRCVDREHFTQISALLCRVRAERTRRHVENSRRRMERMRHQMARNRRFYETYRLDFSTLPIGVMRESRLSSLDFSFAGSVTTKAAANGLDAVPSGETPEAIALYGVADLTDAELLLAHDGVSQWWTLQRADMSATRRIRDVLDVGGLFHKIDAEVTRRGLCLETNPFNRRAETN